MKPFIIAVMLVLSQLSFGLDLHLQDRFAEAEEAYKLSNYQRAIEIYTGLYGEGFRSAELFYNLGCAYYKAGSLGLSRAYFMIAGMHDPLNKDIGHNLNIINKEIKDRFEDGGTNFFADLYDSILTSFTLRVWSHVFFSVLTLFWILICLYFMLYHKRIIVLRILIIVSLMVLFILFPFFRSSYKLYNDRAVGVIISDSTPMRNGPDDSMAALAVLNDGTAVRVTDERNEFYRIMLPNGIVGWVREDKIFVIEPALYFLR